MDEARKRTARKIECARSANSGSLEHTVNVDGIDNDDVMNSEPFH